MASTYKASNEVAGYLKRIFNSEDELFPLMSGKEEKCKTDSKNPEKPSSKAKMVEIIHLRKCTMKSPLCKSLIERVNCILQRNSSNTQESLALFLEMEKCIEMEYEKNNILNRTYITWNHRHGHMTKIWPIRENKVSLQTTTVKDVFDMSCLNEFFQTKSDASDIRKKAEKLTKEYLSFKEEKIKSYRESEIIRKLASKYCKQKGNGSSSSSKHHRCTSLTRMLKKVYGDVKNLSIFSFRPLFYNIQESHESQTNKSKEVHEMARKNRYINVSPQCEDLIYRIATETIIVFKSPCSNTGKTRTDKQKSDSNTANNLQNLERLLFNRGQHDHQQQKSESSRKQLLRDSILHSRQLSRLKKVNSKRGVPSEDMVIQETSTDQNKDEQRKVTLAKRRRKVVGKLTEAFNAFKLDETETLKN